MIVQKCGVGKDGYNDPQRYARTEKSKIEQYSDFRKHSLSDKNLDRVSYIICHENRDNVPLQDSCRSLKSRPHSRMARYAF